MSAGDDDATTQNLDERQAAAYLGLSRNRLAELRKQGKGPACFNPSPKVFRYSRADLDAFRAAKTIGGVSRDPAA